MACGTTYRDCADLPVIDNSMANVADITFANGASGITVSWAWGALTGNVAIIVTAVESPYARADYAVIASPNLSELMALTSEEEYFVSVRREDNGLASPWHVVKMLYFDTAGAEAVLCDEVQVVHDGDYVVHTRIDQFLEQEAGDYIFTEASENISME